MKPGFIYNGIHYVSWWYDEYLNGNIDDLAATGANWAGLLVTWYQQDATASTISPDPQRTPTDAALTYAIEQLHARGLKVMLKPHVDGVDGCWRGEFNPSDVSAWFASYEAFILHYAHLNVEALVIGTEFVKLSGPANQDAWYNLIAKIRAIYSGLLTYAANATHAKDEFTRVSFWDKLDLIGLDAYFPLDEGSMLQSIQSLHRAYDKPVIFTEIGYRSVAGASREPWNFSRSGEYDATEQANCYRAFFDAWIPYSDWIQGAFWWNWPVYPPLPEDTGYTPRNKPAMQVLIDNFRLP